MKSKLLLSIHIGLATILFLISFCTNTSSSFETFSFVFFLSSLGNLLGYKSGTKFKGKIASKIQKNLLILLIVAIITGILFYTLTEGTLAIYGTFGTVFLYGFFSIIYVLKV